MLHNCCQTRTLVRDLRERSGSLNPDVYMTTRVNQANSHYHHYHIEDKGFNGFRICVLVYSASLLHCYFKITCHL